MIGTIGYLGKVSLWLGVSASLLYTLGMTLGAGLVGAALGALGWGVRWMLYLGYDSQTPAVLATVAAVALFGGLRDLKFFRLSLPQPLRQVPQEWMVFYGPRKTSFLWGLAIGLAYSTLIQFSLYYVMGIWVLLSGRPLLGAAVFAVYALTQGGLLVVETLAIAAGARGGGLLGSRRHVLFSRYGGAFLVASAVFLAVRSGLLHR